ncbi:MAG TPA: hypothetical protein VLV18_03040 [Terriglobales bacterium]|nr:hypothetical protein [Terriglobales bacterium]
MVDIIGTIIHLVIAGIIGGIFVWLAAKALGAPRASYWHGILTVVSAIIVTDIISFLVTSLGFAVGWITTIIEVIIILLLIKHFFGVGWIKAIVIAILAVVILIIVIFVLALVGVAFAVAYLKGLFPGVPGA